MNDEKPTTESTEELIQLARDCLTQTLHGPLPVKTSMKLAESVLRVAEERDSARKQVVDVAAILGAEGVTFEIPNCPEPDIRKMAQGRMDAMVMFRGERNEARANLAEASKMWDGPETTDWFEGVRKEAAFQVAKWGKNHDDGKNPEDWFWLLGYLAGKALAAQFSGDEEKAKHHTISAGAALLNWHARMSKLASMFRPGIEAPDAHG